MPKKQSKKLHMLAVRVNDKTMDRLNRHCAERATRENRHVSYREAIEDLINSIKKE